MVAVRKMFFAGVDVSLWSRRKTFEIATRTWRSADTFTLEFDAYNATTAFPVTPAGGAPIWYGWWDSANHANDKTLFCGRYKNMSGKGTTENVRGVMSYTFSTPLSELKAILEYIAFDPTVDDSDDDRVRKLGTLAPLPGWDFTTNVTSTPSITYHSGAGYEALTEYEQKSYEYILNDIATDPGALVDVDYPVRTRRWWITGGLTTPATPSAGVTFYLHYQGANDTVDATYELKDWKAAGDTTTLEYQSGASYSEDWREVIRSIMIAGPRQEAHPVGWKELVNVSPGHGYITKRGGTDGSWDSGAISAQRIKGGDWEAVAQTQEFYLGHETFQHDNEPWLSHPMHTGQLPQTVWRSGDTVHNTLGIDTHLGAPRLQTGLAQVVWDTGAAVCILRSHFTQNRVGQHLIWRYSDPDNYFYVVNSGGDYDAYRRESGTDNHLGNLGVTPANGHEIKVSILSTPTGGQFQIFIDNTLALQINDETMNEHATLHGLGADCDADPTTYQCRFYDFQCTDFWADKAFGLTTEPNVISWVDISYGFVFNTNGTVTVNEGGLTYETDSFTYNDKFRVATALYFDRGTASLQRMVTWDKLPAGMAQWANIRTRTTSVPFIDNSTPLYVAFAGKEQGATLNNITLRKMYANLFIADETTYGAAEGDYPANGLLQSDDLDTFVKRQQRADAIFEQQARPRVALDCTTFPTSAYVPTLGERVLVTNHQAGWKATPSDTRKAMYVTSVQRKETDAHPTTPTYVLTLADRDYDVDLGPQRHLLAKSQRTKRPDPKGAPEQSADDPTVFEWPEPSGDENFGDRVEVQLARVDSAGNANAPQPVGYVQPEARAVQIPSALLTAGGQYVLRSRSVFNNGPAGDWSQSSAFVAPAQAAYPRPYHIDFGVGDGVNAVDVGTYDDIPVPESGTITGWTIAASELVTDPPAACAISVDVEWADAQTFRTTGTAAFVNISGTGAPGFSADTKAESHDLSSWTGTALKTGDRVRFKVAASPAPTCKRFVLTLWVQRAEV